MGETYPAPWRRSRRTGNLWAVVRGGTCAVFQKRGRFHWSICRGRTAPRYSPTNFASEREAYSALVAELAQDAGADLDDQLDARLARDRDPQSAEAQA